MPFLPPNQQRQSTEGFFTFIYQINLYWRNNSAQKYNYIETLFHTLAIYTNFSRPLINISKPAGFWKKTLADY